MSKVIDFIKEHKFGFTFACVFALLALLDLVIPKKEIESGPQGPGDYGPVVVKYAFNTGESVPWEPLPLVSTDKPLWAPNQNPDRKQPEPKNPETFRTQVSRQSMTSLTGYSGNCELPKINREETNSAFCLQCHEQHDVLNSSLKPINAHNSHPWGVDVPIGLPGYQSTLDAQFALVNGKMECTTCHDYWATPQQPKWVSVDQMYLCQGCHDK